jgi:cytochrome c biogenesis protein
VVSRSFYIKEIGSLLFHVSILFFFTGGILGGLTGFSFVKEFHKGEVHAIRDWHYRVRCDWFKVDKNDHGTVTDYTSKLSVLSSDSTPVFSHLIKVNHPLSYKGVRFYQYSYGRQPDAIDDAVLRISGPGLDSGLSEVFPFNTSVRLSTNDLKLTITNFVCDFDLDMGGEFVSSRSDKPNNPAIRVIISKGNDTVFDTWSFLNFPEIHRHVKNAYKITFLSYTPRYFTGIKISRDPGNVFVWLGFACMSFGIILVFYFPNKTYWIFMEPGNAGFSRIIVGASSGPALSAFQKEFKRTCASLKSLLKGEP